MPKKKTEEKKLQPGETFTIRLSRSISPEITEALNGMTNRNQTILNLIELIFVRNKISEDFIQGLLTGTAAGRQPVSSEINAAKEEASSAEEVKQPGIETVNVQEVKKTQRINDTQDVVMKQVLQFRALTEDD